MLHLLNLSCCHNANFTPFVCISVIVGNEQERGLYAFWVSQKSAMNSVPLTEMK